MAVERPDGEHIEVDVDTMGGVATSLKALCGLTAWYSEDHAKLRFHDGSGFGPAEGLQKVNQVAMQIAWEASKAIEKWNTHYADAVAAAAERYGATDRHSAAAVDDAARRMADPAVDGQ